MMLFRGVAIGVLPWLSTKYAPMAAAVTIVAMLRARMEPSRDGHASGADRDLASRLVRVLLLDLGVALAIRALRVVGANDVSVIWRTAGPA